MIYSNACSNFDLLTINIGENELLQEDLLIEKSKVKDLQDQLSTLQSKLNEKIDSIKYLEHAQAANEELICKDNKNICKSL